MGKRVIPTSTKGGDNNIMPKEWFKLSRQKIMGLLTLYIILLAVGIIITISTILYESIESYFDFKLTISTIAIIGGIGTALCGSSIFYLRKLYKSCINSDVEDDLPPFSRTLQIS